MCGYKNHFAVMCKNKVKNGKNEANKQINTVERESKIFEYLSLDRIEIDSMSNTWTDNVKINDINVEIKLDTGAQLNVMPIELYKKIKLGKSAVKIKTFGGFTKS